MSGIVLPEGLVDGSKLPEPVFTPTTKAPVGEHDLPMSPDEVEAELGADVAAEVSRLTRAILARGNEIAAERGILIADTKVEFGVSPDGTGGLVLADEVLTPDSSRFWPAELWEPGHPQPSYDKQFVRDWLTSSESGWDRKAGGPPPELPEHVVEQTRAKYVEAYERLTGETFSSRVEHGGHRLGPHAATQHDATAECVQPEPSLRVAQLPQTGPGVGQLDVAVPGIERAVPRHLGERAQRQRLVPAPGRPPGGRLQQGRPDAATGRGRVHRQLLEMGLPVDTFEPGETDDGVTDDEDGSRTGELLHGSDARRERSDTGLREERVGGRLECREVLEVAGAGGTHVKEHVTTLSAGDPSVVCVLAGRRPIATSRGPRAHGIRQQFVPAVGR